MNYLIIGEVSNFWLFKRSPSFRKKFRNVLFNANKHSNIRYPFSLIQEGQFQAVVTGRENVIKLINYLEEKSKEQGINLRYAFTEFLVQDALLHRKNLVKARRQIVRQPFNPLTSIRYSNAIRAFHSAPRKKLMKIDFVE